MRLYTDELQGAGACLDILATGLTCKALFCDECIYDGFCAKTCGSCIVDNSTSLGAVPGVPSSGASVLPDGRQRNNATAPQPLSDNSLEWCLWFGTEQKQKPGTEAQDESTESTSQEREYFCWHPMVWMACLPIVGALCGLCIGCCSGCRLRELVRRRPVAMPLTKQERGLTPAARAREGGGDNPLSVDRDGADYGRSSSRMAAVDENGRFREADFSASELDIREPSVRTDSRRASGRSRSRRDSNASSNESSSSVFTASSSHAKHRTKRWVASHPVDGVDLSMVDLSESAKTRMKRDRNLIRCAAPSANSKPP